VSGGGDRLDSLDPPAPPLLGIVGPTASGKTDLALEIARRLPVEILVADSRQVYRGMDIGTAKPSVAARASIPHHLLDLVDPDQPFTVAQWLEHARRAAREIADRGRVPMLVGGTGLYVTALVDGHDYASQPWAPHIRARLDAELESDGLAPLAARLLARSPELASMIDLHNPRRVLRALERVEAGGGGASAERTPYPGPLALVGIARPRDELYRRIDERARRLFEADGLLDEVRRLLDAGYGPELRPMSGHGYREAAQHLAGEWDLDRAIDVTARRTRQYAKRQLTWFGRDPRISWLPTTLAVDSSTLAEGAVKVLGRALS
jgi:tRNA dimethylallyltransferase